LVFASQEPKLIGGHESEQTANPATHRTVAANHRSAQIELRLVPNLTAVASTRKSLCFAHGRSLVHACTSDRP
jgi:hypothetical protein